MVRAGVLVQARAASAARPGRSGRPAARRRVRADRLQDRTAQERWSVGGRRPAVPVRRRRTRGVEPRRLPAGLLLRARRPEGDRARRPARTAFEWIQEVAMEVADGILSQGFEPTPSFAACSVCDYRLVCPAAEGVGARRAGLAPARRRGSSSPRWRRNRWSSRAIVSPEGSGPSSLASSADACSRRSTNACTSGSLCTARLT